MSKNRNLSLEALHLYPKKDSLEKDIQSSLKALKMWKAPIELAYKKHEVVSKVFIDDYTFSVEKLPSRSEIQSALLKEFEKESLPLDYIVYESDCARSCYHLKALIVEEPVPGQGSFLGEAGTFNQQNDVIDLRYSPEVDLVGLDFDHFSREARNNIAIALKLSRSTPDQEVSWSCPAAAAWWQLIRLGALMDFPEEVENEDSSLYEHITGAPAGTWKNPKSELSFICDNTVSILPASYISVEHAVRTILKFIPETGPVLRKKLTATSQKDSLSAISYIFHG